MPDADPPPPAETASGARMSPQQRRLWLLGEAYGTAVRRLAVELTGELDEGALRGAAASLQARHDILRTGFRVLPGLRLPLQMVDDVGDLAWTEVDLRGMPPERQDERIEALLSAEGRRTAADLASGPAWRITLAELGEGRWILVLELPALCADGETLRGLAAELAAAYRERGGGPSADEPMQYWQYSEWLNEILDEASAEVEEGQTYWRGRADLAAWTGREAFPELPGERPRPEGAPFRAAELALAAGEPMSSPACLAAAWLAVLWRLTGEADLAVGAALDGREFEELRTAAGPFARVLPLRASLAAGVPFVRLVEEVGEALAEASLQQRYFVWEPTRAAVRDPRRPPFFPFAFEHRQVGGPVESAGVTFGIRDERGDAEPFKVKLIAVERAGEWALRLAYDGDRYGEPEMQRLGGYLRALLVSASARPETSLQDLDLLPADEHARLLELAAGETAPTRPALLAHQLFAEQAARTPDADALVFGGERTSYAELNRRAERVARRLRQLGVGPERVVGLALEPSAAAVVGLLAILKAGGAFLPLDPHGPAERRAFMLRDSGAGVLVTGAALAEGFRRGFAGERVLLDADGAAEGDEPAAGEALGFGGEAGAIGGGNLAYVLYTSGSTGTPKGVGVEHRSLASYLAFVDRVLFGGEVRICPWLSALTFDASWKQVLAPLTRGGAVWGLGGAELDPAALVASLAGRRAVALNGTPSLWKALLDEVGRTGAAEALAGVCRLLLGGERLSRELFARSTAALPAAEVWNLYGPTETTANSAVARLAAGGAVTIGRPIAGTRIHLLDAAMQPVPAGVPGELFVAGAGVARGYLGRPDLTAARFLPDPFAVDPGGRLYRTGDRGRLAPSLETAEIEYLGRTDHQVKVRGYRIELEEIEARLALHPAVREAAVLAETAPGDGGETRLVAYVVAESRQGLSADALRAALREMLPEYMVPAAFVSLPRLPLLPGGKVDRGALQRSGSALVSERPFVAPRTATERRLAEIWAAVLGRESVGVEDDFFELGGHSIQSIQITHRAQSAGFTLSPRDLLQQPTIAALAALVDAAAPPAPAPPPLPAADAAAAPPGDPDWEEGSL